MKRFFVCFLKLMVFNIFIISFVSADSNSKVISEEQAGVFHYTITAENRNLTWKIGDKKSHSVIEENKDNVRNLESFRTAVDDIDSQRIELIIYVAYLIIIIVAVGIVYKKNNVNKKSILAIGILFANYAIYKSFVAVIYLEDALDDAKLYYAVLT